MTSRARLVHLRALLPLRHKLGWLLILAWASFVVAPTAAVAAVPTPMVSLPPAGTRGFPFWSSSLDLDRFGYTEKEYLISGNARPSSIPARSEITGFECFARRNRVLHDPYPRPPPTNPERFNGTVVVEWLNVSGGIDTSPEWAFTHTELLREGYAWVGVSAQFVGAAFLPSWDTVRYASIAHPGDSWSYDIFSQAGMAILHGTPLPLGPLTHFVRTVLAAGESQSAFRLFTYYNAIQPRPSSIKASSSTARDPARHCRNPSPAAWVASSTSAPGFAPDARYRGPANCVHSRRSASAGAVPQHRDRYHHPGRRLQCP